jgi:hypothetical protein
MPWTRKLPTPIVLKDGRSIATLEEARAFMLGLPERSQARPYWQYAAELLIDAAEGAGDIKGAYHQLKRAITAEGPLL